MDTLTNILVIFIALIFGYLVGSIPTGVIIGRLFYKKDPRDYGSHASGGTNTSRTLGKTAGVIVIALDALKAIAVFWTAWALLTYVPYLASLSLFDGGLTAMWATLVACSIGHCYPIYIRFRGGKTVAVYMGSTGGVTWAFFALDLIVFNVVYKAGKKKNIVSFASIFSGLILTLLTWAFTLWAELGATDISFLFWHFGFAGLTFSYQQAVATTLIYALLVWRHRENIARMKNNTEGEYKLVGK